MPIVNINGKQVHIEEGSESAKVAAEYLTKNPDNAKALFDERIGIIPLAWLIM